MYTILLALSCLALIGAHFLRLPNKSSFIGNVLSFSAALLLTTIGIRAITNASGVGRATQFDAFVNRAALIAENSDAPLIVFSGASFSRNAIDDDRLTYILREKGYPHQAINISLEAASLVERKMYLDALIARSSRVPDIMLLEVAQITDTRPTFIFNNSKFSSRAINQFNVEGVLWSTAGLLEDGCSGLVDCAKESVFLGAHGLVNVFNLGLVSQGKTLSHEAPQMSYDGALEAKETIDGTDRQHGLTTQNLVSPRAAHNWARSLRAIQHRDILAAGTSKVGYYFPPVISPGARAYVADICAGELADYSCIAPTDPALLAKLDADVWLDREHLLDDGAAVYVAWLADQLIASGILDEAAPQQEGAQK